MAQSRLNLSTALLLLAATLPAGVDAAPRCDSLHALQRLNACELEQLYAGADAGNFPVGCYKGQVLLLTGTRMPKVKAFAFNLAWKGKCFEPDGRFINRWPGFQALPSQANPGPSWYDGRPCTMMEYPAGTPLFANLHDELRELAPGLYLGRLYERCPEPRFLGYIALQTLPERCGR